MKKFQLIAVVVLLVGGQVWCSEHVASLMDKLKNVLSSHNKLHVSMSKFALEEYEPTNWRQWQEFIVPHQNEVIVPLGHLAQDIRETLQKQGSLTKKQLAQFQRRFKRLVNKNKKMVGEDIKKFKVLWDKKKQLEITDATLEPQIKEIADEIAQELSALVDAAPSIGTELEEKEAEAEELESGELEWLFKESEAKQKREGKSKAQIEAGWQASY